MSGDGQTSKSETSEQEKHHHKRKSTESLLNKELIRKALNIKIGQTILDAGCGNGYMSKVFSKEVTESGRVYALDTLSTIQVGEHFYLQIFKNKKKQES